MKKWLIIGGIFLFLFITYSYVKGKYNTMFIMSEEINGKWAQVENVYQRRADLIPNIVATVKGYAGHEKETLEGVVNARAKATSVNIDPSNLDINAISKFQAAQSGLSSALGRLMVVVEKYPDLKADKSFLALQEELKGTENRIAVERKRFNEAVQIYNMQIGTFPNNIFANNFGFSKKAYFEAKQGAEEAPKVQF